MIKQIGPMGTITHVEPVTGALTVWQPNKPLTGAPAEVVAAAADAWSAQVIADYSASQGGTTFSEDLRASVIASGLAQIETKLVGARGEYPQSEVDSWGTKIAAARAVKGGGGDDDEIAMIAAEADERGITSVAMADDILGAARPLMVASAKMAAARSAFTVAARDAVSKQDLEAAMTVLTAKLAQM